MEQQTLSAGNQVHPQCDETQNDKRVDSAQMRWFNRDTVGIIAIVAVYVLFAQIYVFTLAYSIIPNVYDGYIGSILNLIFFTFFTLMALLSHFQCMLTNPGVLPKNYEKLNLRFLSKKFAKLLDERDSIFEEAQRRKLMRSGALDETKNNSGDLTEVQNKHAEKYAENINCGNDDTQNKVSETYKSEQLTKALIEGNKTQIDSKNSRILTILLEEQRVFDNRRTASEDFFNIARESLSVKRNTKVDRILSKYCSKCNSIRPPHAHHCGSCQRCVAYMDHHCPWVNNCVGIYNQKLFVLFNLYTIIATIYSLCINLTQGLNQLALVQGRPSFDWGSFTQCLSIIEAFAFGLFILVVLCDQISIILNRISVLEKVKLYENKKFSYKKRGCKNFKVTFGGNFGIKWFLPIALEGTFELEELYD